MPTLLILPSRAVRSRVFDSARWDGYRPRADDIIIATYSKCGTTWMQRIVSMLLFQSAAPRPIWDLSPWPDMRLFGPIEAELAKAEAQTHRRFFKTHLPLDALPLYAGVKIIHVARDGRDAAMSLHNHLANLRPELVEVINAINRADPKFGDDYPIRAGSGAVLFAVDRRRRRPRRRGPGFGSRRELVLERALEPRRSARALQRPEGRSGRGDAQSCGLPRHRNAGAALERSRGCGGLRGHEGTGRRVDSGCSPVVGGRRIAVHEQRHQRPLADAGLSRRSAALRRKGTDPFRARACPLARARSPR